MWTPGRRFVGGATVLGGLCVVVASIPTRWFGTVPTDSYVFDPPTYSPLWIERTIVPAVSIAAALLTLAGLVALFHRDREWMERWQRWFAVVAVVGAAVGTFATVLLASNGDGAGGDPTATLNVLFAVLLGLVGVVLAGPGLLAWGIGYLRAGRRRLGTALAGGVTVPVLLVAVTIALDVDPGPAGGVLMSLPAALLAVGVGYDLWTRAA
ncbi:hypothetical protein [Haloplanus salilacus]|uniref:hypothetical protein n=1 Tax=Haloplanus salilacus TaxID=2949994 RepID=UPI0030D57FAA